MVSERRRILLGTLLFHFPDSLPCQIVPRSHYPKFLTIRIRKGVSRLVRDMQKVESNEERYQVK